jgi:hypothetical protein
MVADPPPGGYVEDIVPSTASNPTLMIVSADAVAARSRHVDKANPTELGKRIG